MSRLRRIPGKWLAFLFALGAYSLAAGSTLARQSIAPHYVYLADALLHGRLDLAQPPVTYDLLIAAGKAYVAASPMPALLLTPFVALFGAGVSDILFGVVAGALNAALVHDLFKRWWLTLLFAFGTPHLYLSTLGSVWFNAHVVAIFFGLLAIREARREPARWFRAGVWLACAGFARPTMLFGAMFFVMLIRRGPIGSRARSLAAFGAAVALGVAAHGWYNAARFGSPFDFGYQYTAGAPNIIDTYARYGGFNPRFLPCNLFVSILNPPEFNGYVPPITYQACDYLVQGVNLSDASQPIAPNPLGMSLFIATPAFLLLLTARRRDAGPAWIGLLATMIPLWMYHNTGSLQFGYRYWMDAAPMWLMLLAARAKDDRARYNLPEIGLTLASIAINVWGFLWMFEKFFGTSRLP